MRSVSNAAVRAAGALGLLSALGAPSSPARSQLEVCSDYPARSTRCVASGKLQVGRGSITIVTFKAPLIDHTAASDIRLAPAVPGMTVARRADSGGCLDAEQRQIGCLRLNVTVATTVPLGTTPVLFAGRAAIALEVRRGARFDQTVTQSVTPARWGEPVTVTLTGRDIGGVTAQSLTVALHTVMNVTSADDRLSFTVRANPGTTPSRTVPIAARDQSFPSVLYRIASTGAFPLITYDAPPATGCLAGQQLRIPRNTSPADGAPFGSTNTQVELQWDPPSLAGTGQETAHERYVVELYRDAVAGQPLSTDTTPPVPTPGQTVRHVVGGLVSGTTYAWRVRPRNCGDFSQPTRFVIQ